MRRGRSVSYAGRVGHDDRRGPGGALSADLPLRELVIRNRADDRGLLGISRFAQLERLHMAGVPSDEEIAELRQLPRLARLTIADPESVAALARLESLDVTVDVADPPPA
ncbi:hypothetical protein ACTMTJ_26120 [Phytohabitans sp. LJ34]|uniref:hypothetical protein n=1 Tax=Phytohabitans sp. LJ34 TaxID=3452217 RepID=UPI003F8C2ED2